MEGFEKNKSADRKETDPSLNLVKLVDRSEMLDRLRAINDEGEYQQRIYPYLEQIAGKTLPPIAVAGVITLAIDRFTLGDRFSPGNQMVRMFVPHFVDAMLDDPAKRKAVNEILEGRLPHP